MTDALPPFDPPYITCHGSGSDMQYVETLVDGTTRPVAMPFSTLALGSNYSETKAKAPTQKINKPSNKASAEVKPQYSGQRAALYLNVAFAEKDSVKQLGAKWDAAKRKWYVPHGVNVNLFAAWWPDDLKPR